MVTQNDRSGAVLQTTGVVVPVDGISGPAGAPHSRQPGWSGPSFDATRYLSAAMYLDGDLALSVVADKEDRHHARISSEGVDMDEVERHAAAALRRRAVRDVLLAACLLGLVAGVLGRNLGLFLLAVIATWAVIAVEAYLVRYEVLVRQITAVRKPAAKAVPAEGDRGSRDNVTIYHDYMPFVGYGQMAQSWSFVLDCDKPSEPGGTTTPFTVAELHSAVVDGINALGWGDIQLEDRLFVRGTDIRDNTALLPNPESRPLSRIDHDVITGIMADPHAVARQYLRISYHGWNDELVVSAFLRLVLHERSLFVEYSLCLLTPIKSAYHEIDDLMSRPTFKQLRELAARSLRETPGLALRSIPAVADLLLEPIQRSRLERLQLREIREHRAFNYGARSSLRERASDNGYNRYFQRIDKDRYAKVIENRVLESIIGFLDEHGIETFDANQRRTTILNSGVLVTDGGTLTAGSVATGPGSRATSRLATAAKTLRGQ